MGKWITLTELGKEFGYSAVAIGKELDNLGYRDPDTKKPTALSEKKKFARIVKYTAKNGVISEMVIWSKDFLPSLKRKLPNDEFLNLKAALIQLHSFNAKPFSGDKVEIFEGDCLIENLETILKEHLKKHSLEKLKKIVEVWPKESTTFLEFLKHNFK